MRRFFTEPQNIKEDIIEIFEDSRHIEKVLRMTCGERVLVFDGTGTEYVAELFSIEKNVCRAKVISRSISLSEPKTQLTLYQGLPKSGKMELIVQKAVELGVCRIVPVIMERCVVKINSKSAAEKTQRWQKVSVEAAKQCGRGIVPKVSDPISFDDALSEMQNSDLAIMPYEELGHQGKTGLKELLKKNETAVEVSIMVGPEGGFSEEEAEKALQKGIHTVGLGKRILRTETFSGAILPVILYERGEF